MGFIDLIFRGFEINSCIEESGEFVIFKFRRNGFNYASRIPQDQLLSFKFNKDWLNAWENRVVNEVIKNQEEYRERWIYSFPRKER